MPKTLLLTGWPLVLNEDAYSIPVSVPCVSSCKIRTTVSPIESSVPFECVPREPVRMPVHNTWKASWSEYWTILQDVNTASTHAEIGIPFGFFESSATLTLFAKCKLHAIVGARSRQPKGVSDEK